MANEEHLKIIKQGVKVWNAWSSKNPGITPNLSQAELRRAKLSGAALMKADLMRADLRWADLTKAKLSGADLRHANLFNANLKQVDLSGADLNQVDLRGANLNGARLSGADLSRADLRSVDLSGVNLKEANLGEANLSRADLSEAELSGANFSRSRFKYTIFGNTDLSTVKGLETVLHLGPSTIGIDTWFRSNGKIPEIFLRGVGLPEIFITYSGSLLAQPIDFYSCFISYSHADKSFARRLHDSLQGRGIRCWLDEHALLPGDKIYTEVDRGIRLWDKVLLCCSKDALSSWWVDNEIKIAFDKEQQLWRDRKKEVLALIPLNLDDYLFSGQWQSGLATEVKARLAANFIGWENDNKKFEEQFERLVKALRTDGGGREPQPLALL